MSSLDGVQRLRLDPQPLWPVSWHRLGIVAALILATDQATKSWAHTQTLTWAEPVTNSELALGVAGGHPIFLAVVMALSLSGFGAYLVRRVSRRELPFWVAGILIGGATSNLADRALVGVVRDFIPTPWLILNLADIALLVGAIGYVSAILAQAAKRR